MDHWKQCKKYWSDYKNWGGDGREFTTTILLHKKFPSCPKLKIWKTIFLIFWKKSNLKNCFANFNFGTGGELVQGEDHLHKLSSPSKFLWPILAVIDNLYRSSNCDCYFDGDRRSLFWQPLGIVLSATTSDRYFGGDWWSLIACPHWQTVKTVV